MNTVLVWFMVTVGGANSNQVVYSPPMEDLATCQFLKKTTEEIVPDGSQRLRARCIQIKTVVTK